MSDRPDNAALADVWTELRGRQPLTHVITHQIAAGDAANLLICAGASPVFAEHPDEMDDIVARAAASGASLGNVNPSRLAAIRRAGAASRAYGKPLAIDCVGVGASPLRLAFAQKYIADFAPAVVKGNISEIKALAGLAQHAHGVDAAPADALGGAWRASDDLAALKDYALARRIVVLATGARDLVVDGTTDGAPALAVANGVPLLGRITASGCMLAALVVAALGVAPPLLATLTAAAAFGLAGEKAAAISGPDRPGTFHTALLDAMAGLTADDLLRGAKIES